MEFFSVFFLLLLPPHPFLLLSLFILLLIIIIIIISNELLAQCDECLGWMQRAGLVAGLRVGQVSGVLFLPGFGVSSSSPLVPGHQTSMCDSGVNYVIVLLSLTNNVIRIPFCE